MVDSINNQTVWATLGKVGLANPRVTGDYWMRVFTEVLEECELRGYSYPYPLNAKQLKEAMFDPKCVVPDVDSVLDKHKLSAKPYLLKFGEPRWLAEAQKLGRFRISPASSYYSEGHNHARRDQELRRTLLPHPQNDAVLQYLTDIGRCPPHGQFCSEISLGSPVDYYLFSMSMEYSARLFSDFNSCACLVIFDPLVFLKRFGKAVTEHLGSGWSHTVGPVEYFDPVRADPSSVDVIHCKPFKQAYQFEMRLTWTAPEEGSALEPIFTSVGSLEDCSELVTLESHPPVI